MRASAGSSGAFDYLIVTYIRVMRLRTAIAGRLRVGGLASEFAGTSDVVDAEALGIDRSVGRRGTDGIVPLAYLAALTSRLRLATGILQITARAAPMTAMTAMTLDHVSNGRFVLGLGASGPQVVEGLHGRPYARPLERLKETVDVIRLAIAGRRSSTTGTRSSCRSPTAWQGAADRSAAETGHSDPPRYPRPQGPPVRRAAADGWVGTASCPRPRVTTRNSSGSERR
jgi:alkanesulfonate monooxygenase SsuD/methylene tetrahydromethanopterin reductase-like flavin-dependent oxidoreductase (luciferase family)